MRGIVISKGSIGTQEGKYFTYEGYENLEIGDEVDFVASEDGKATEIFVIEKTKFKSSSDNANNSKFSSGEFYNSEFSTNKYSNAEFFKNSSRAGNGFDAGNGFGDSPQDLSNVKLFGILGSLIGLCSAIMYVGWFFAFCAFLLILLALHNVGKISGSNTLFITYLKGIVANFVGIGFVWLGVILGAVLFFAGGGGSSIFGILVALFGVFLLVYAFLNWIKTYFELSYLSGNNMFKYFAIVYIIGVCSTWLFGLGYIIMGIAFALQVFGWWQLNSLKKAS